MRSCTTPARFVRTVAVVLLALVMGLPLVTGPVETSSAAATTGTLSVQAGLPGGFRLGYGDPGAAAANAANYRVIVLNADAASYISIIRRNNPAALVLVYKEASFATNWDPTGISRGVGYNEASAHPEWFLTDSGGRRIESDTWEGNFLMDVKSATYQQAWARNVAAELARNDWDGVYMDDVNWRASFAGVAPARYPTDSTWRAATRAFLAGVTPTVRANGKLAILNIAEGHAAPGIWADWLTFADGAMEEHWTNWSNAVGGPFVYNWGSTGWKGQLDNAAAAVRMGKISLLRVGGVDGDVEAMRYGLATYHLINDGRQTIAPPRFHNPPTYPEQSWDLGAPVAPYRTEQTNVYRRDFAAGTVIVNASGSTSATVDLGGTFLDHAGNAVTRLTLGPTRGAILRRVGGPTTTTTAPPTARTGSVYLSDLTPSSAPVNGWGSYERDRANGELPLGDGARQRIGGVSYLKGLGVNAGSDLRFRVPTGCTTFSAVVGIDDEVGNAGSVVFEVWNGTKARLFRSSVRTGSQGGSQITVALRGASDLRLVVTDGQDNNWFDHADWADAKIVCS